MRAKHVVIVLVGIVGLIAWGLVAAQGFDPSQSDVILEPVNVLQEANLSFTIGKGTSNVPGASGVLRLDVATLDYTIVCGEVLKDGELVDDDSWTNILVKKKLGDNDETHEIERDFVEQRLVFLVNNKRMNLYCDNHTGGCEGTGIPRELFGAYEHFEVFKIENGVKVSCVDDDDKPISTTLRKPAPALPVAMID